MPPKPPTKSKYEQSLEKTVRGQQTFAVPTSAVRKDSSSKYSVVIYSTGNYAGKARLLEWTPDGSRIATGRTISIDEANVLAGRGTAAQRGGVSPGAGGPERIATTPTDEALRKQIAELRALKPDKDGIYTYKGKQYTQVSLNEEINRLEAPIQEREVAGATGTVAQTQRQLLAQERTKLVQTIADFNQRLEYAKNLAESTGDPNIRRRALGWVDKLTGDQQRLVGLLDAMDKTGKIPANYSLPPVPSPQNILNTSSSETGLPQQTVTGPGQYGVMPTGSVGQASATGPVPVGQREGQPQGVSRVPTVSLEQINAARRQQGLPEVELVNSKYREVASKKEVPASEIAATPRQTTTPATTVADGGTGGAATGGTPAGAVPPATVAPGAPAVPQAWEQAAREQFGAYYEVIKNDPEIMKLIEDDITLGLSDQQYQARLEQTRWWRTTTASARAWEEDKARDPATLQTRIDNQLAALRSKALTLGLRLRDDVLAKLAEDSLKFGWSTTVVDNSLGAEALRSAGGVSDLRRGYIGQTIRATAGAYGVPLSDVTFNEWVGKIATGQENEASFQAFALDIAKNLYPSLAPSLDKGISFRAVTDPYRQAASRILEINPETIDFADPKWAQAFTARDDKGQQMMMTYGEWNDYLRTNPTFGYEYTDGAKERAFTVVNRLAELFGAA